MLHAITVFALLASSTPTPEENCSAWSFDGYVLGMSKEDASKLRKVKYEIGEGFRVREKNEFSGYLGFDEQGLWHWRREHEFARRDDATTDVMIQDLTARLGDPVFKQIAEANKSYMPRDRELAWRSTECNAALIVTVEYFFAVDSLDVHLHLVRLSKLSAYPQVSARAAHQLERAVADCTVEQILEMNEMGLTTDQINAACANLH